MDRIELTTPEAIAYGKSLFADHQFENAELAFRAAMDNGGGFDAINGLAMSLNELDRSNEALGLFNKAASILEGEAKALMANKAKAYAAVGQTELALNVYNKLVKDAPVPFLLYSRALVLLQMGRHEDAIREFDCVLELDPGNDLARFGRGFAYLVLGDYAQGFRDYEFRLKDDLDEPNVPLWTGSEDLNGKTILVHGEMGLGDNIMFARYLPMLQKMGATVVAVVPDSQFSIMPAGVICKGLDKTTWPKLDYWCRFMSLAWLFKTTRDTVPPPYEVGYRAFRGAIGRLMDAGGRKLKVGLCWSGSPKSKYDAWRSVPLEQLAPLWDLPVEFYSFQMGVRDSDKAAFERLPMADLVPQIKDFGDTACAMRELDLMITCDTSVAHMAGTVGVPTYVMLTAFRTYWLWISKLKTSPWYPSVSVFRQEKDGEWGPVVDAIKAAMLQRVAA